MPRNQVNPSVQLLLGFVIALLLFWLIRYSNRLPEKQRKRWLFRIALGMTTVIFIVLAITGRLNFIVAAIAAALLFIRRIFGLVQYIPLLKKLFAKLNDFDEPGNVTTSLLHMTLDEASGQMEGEVLAGRFTGRRLGSMNSRELMDLYVECRRHHPDSVPILEAYLDRTLEQEWRDRATHAGEPPRDNAEMTRAEALAILGLGADASPDEIISAHRRMMQKVHPDHGGSNYLAAKVNRAKELLLNA